MDQANEGSERRSRSAGRKAHLEVHMRWRSGGEAGWHWHLPGIGEVQKQGTSKKGVGSIVAREQQQQDSRGDSSWGSRIEKQVLSIIERWQCVALG